ncbi:hypothetical protein FQN60_006536 [Etheostoma spectabile]|uniref:Uncharacterized protein n=1 Tax=Etheostoma spectabile TaxID=54343 RepID=A0A5J5CEH7_9PERO|nr:hypothetical protein FQN60_006536 [Etheostoma spectabile]
MSPILRRNKTPFGVWLFFLGPVDRCGAAVSYRCCSDLVLLSFILLPDAVGAHLFVVLLQGGHVLSGLRELPLLHPLSHVPVDEGPLGVHQVELVVEASPGLGDGGGVAQHAHGPLHLGQVSSRNHGGRLVVDAHLEACGTPVHKLDGALGFDGGDGRVDVFGDYVAAVQEAAGHVFAVTRVAFHHLIGRLEAGVAARDRPSPRR